MKRLKKLKIINKIILVIILMVGFTGCVDTRLDMGEVISVEPSEEVTNPNSTPASVPSTTRVPSP
ncbi:MAG: hypothetical protein ACTIH2_02360 [Anaerococcus sp.]